MRKYTYLFCLLFLSLNVIAQQIKTPDEFIGHALGDKFTPHAKIVDYFKYAASAMPQMVKVEQYGETNEGRPLIVAIIASKEKFFPP